MTDRTLIGSVDPPELQVMTYNIRRQGMAPPWSRDRWSRRKHLLRRLLRAEQPTLLGAQEALPEQAEFVAESLGPRYGSIGRGRDAVGGGERCPIYFDGDRLELRSWRQLALSATPGVAGSRSWGNRTPRIVVSAEFADRVTGARIAAFNTHLDHLSARSRRASARMLAQLAHEAQRRDPAASIVVTGDMNTGASSAAIRRLTAEGRLRDTWDAATTRLTPEWRTLSQYRRPRAGGRRIDLILVGPGVDVRSCGVNAVRYAGRAPSDHEPVQAVLGFASGADGRDASS